MYRADKIRAYQAAKQLTDKELAAKAGLGRTTVSLLSNGKLPDPRLSTLEAIANALDTTVADLVEKAVA